MAGDSLMKKHLALVLATVFLVLGAVAAPAEGQTLAEAAKREAERRAKLQQLPIKTYTSADVEVRPGTPARVETIPAPAAASNAAGATEAKPGTATDAKAAKAEPPKVREKRDEDHWRERAGVIRDRLNGLRANVEGIDARLAELRLELESASGARATALNGEIQQAAKDLTRFQRDLRLIEQEWTNFEDRARAAKIPLSWIR
jgi:hypothetical protein